ncbi:MAG TPA: hypothetical protein VK121_11735 [Pseudogracilibacillus sp.]|nr:hypothetical protein [Pseudogracilibacillus sp.]
MKDNLRLKRQKQVSFAVGLASIDGGRPSSFTKQLLIQYENGSISSKELKEAIVEKYAKVYR